MFVQIDGVFVEFWLLETPVHLAVLTPPVFEYVSHLLFTGCKVDVYKLKAVALAEFGVLALL